METQTEVAVPTSPEARAYAIATIDNVIGLCGHLGTVIRQEIDIPLAAYHVSGEYAMVHAAAQNGWLELEPVAFEHIGAIKRAGADLILTYFSRLIAEGLQ